MARRHRLVVLFAVSLVAATLLMLWDTAAVADDAKINTLQDMFARLGACWRSPELQLNNPGMQITVMVTFKRNGEILGQPKITYESEYASDEDRLIYRTAVVEALQRCTPMPFTDGLGNAVAGRPVRFRFDARRTKSTEKRSWQTTRTL